MVLRPSFASLACPPCARQGKPLRCLLLLATLAFADVALAVPTSSPEAAQQPGAAAGPVGLPSPVGADTPVLENPAPAANDEPASEAPAVASGAAEQRVAASAARPLPQTPSPRRMQKGCSLRDYGAPVERGQIAAAIYNTCSGFSLHKPMFLTGSYSPRFPGAQSEVFFQLSGKVQAWDFGPGALYFAYSQKSFFQIANQKRSKLFRESDYNPEAFLRLPKPFAFLPNWSLDAGFEHESNGEDLPGSRSWNRIYLTPYWASGRQAVSLKAWWRIPENKNRPSTDPSRDDNPDIGSYYGYTELHLRQDFPHNNSLVDVMLRGNLLTGRGAVQVDLSTEIGPLGAGFLRIFNGYGESLIDYNRSVTRVALGIALQR